MLIIQGFETEFHFEFQICFYNLHIVYTSTMKIQYFSRKKNHQIHWNVLIFRLVCTHTQNNILQNEHGRLIKSILMTPKAKKNLGETPIHFTFEL